jgi:hypothetical protein
MKPEISARTREKDKRILTVLATGKYTVSPSGRIFNNSHRNTNECRELRYFRDRDGYLLVQFLGVGIVRVHRVSALVFLPRPRVCKWVTHKNGNITDNRWRNLEWASPVETVATTTRIGKRADQRGENNPYAVLTPHAVRAIRTALHSASQSKVARRYGVGQKTVSDIHRGVTWRHVK